MSLASVAVSSTSYSGGQNVLNYFRKYARADFVVCDIRFYGINIGSVTSPMMQRLSDAPLLWISPVSWIAGAVHVTQQSIALGAVGYRNEHWYLVLRNTKTNAEIILEYSQQGLGMNMDTALPQDTSRQDESVVARPSGSLLGKEIAKYLTGWVDKPYNLQENNCQCFVRLFTEFFANQIRVNSSTLPNRCLTFIRRFV